MPHSLRWPDAAFDGEQHLAQPLGLGADGLGLAEDAARLARRVEHALFDRQHHAAGALDAGVGAQQRLRLEVADLDAVLEHAHQHPAADGRRPRGVAAVVDAHAAVVADGALRLGEVLHAHASAAAAAAAAPPRTWPAPGGARCRGCARPPTCVSQCSRKSFCSSSDSKRRPFKAVAWVWPIAFSTLPLRLGSRTLAGSATTP